MRMRSLALHASLVGLCLVPLVGLAASKCKINQVAELPITMNSLRPLIDTKLNGKDAKFIIDSGAFYSMITAPTAAEYGLKTYAAPFGFVVVGVGGRTTPDVTRVKEFTLLGVPIKNVEFLVGGSEVGYQGLLGQNLLESFDVEYDLAHGAIRLFKTDNCDKTLLAYWVTADQHYSTMPIEAIKPSNPHTVGTGKLNGQNIRMTFDTGAFNSILSTRAAARAGIKPDSPGVIEGGGTGGIGSHRVRSYIATFGSLEIGDGEQVKNAKLRFAELFDDTDMLLGADFFISHRVFVANREHRLYMTYNGGPVFDLSHRGTSVAAADEDAPSMPSGDADIKDSAELARRGSALAARKEFRPALADLSRAVELAPEDPEFYYQRANAYWASGDGTKALADFDKVIELKHDFLPAYIPRAEINLARKEHAAALVDLDTVNDLAPKQADLRFMLAEIYQRAGKPEPAREQYGIWISSHPDDSRMTVARGSRCLVSALANRELKTALDDCEFAVRHTDKSSPAHANLLADRGLVHLRMGDTLRAMGDFNEALKLMPDNARAYYGRAVAESRGGKTQESAQDFAHSQQLDPALGARMQGYGIAP